jgi:hypothetical protein
MRHRATLLRATLTALLVLAAVGTAFAAPFEGAPSVPYPPPGARPGSNGLPLLPPGVTQGSVPKNVAVAETAQAVPPAPAAGPVGGASDREDCSESENPDQKIASCSRVIADDTAKAVSRAQAYRSRGTAYYNKGDFDRAIADFSEAIKLDPNIVPRPLRSLITDAVSLTSGRRITIWRLPITARRSSSIRA